MAAQLRQRTRASHEQVEADLDLLDPALTPARLGAVLVRFHSLWDAAERALDAWAADAPALAGELDWPRRRRAEVLRGDVAALGAPLDRAAAPSPVAVPATDADALGWLYVAEGSTLGGAVISRRIVPLGLAVRSFTPYAEGPGPMWRRYHEVLEAWVDGDEIRAHAVASAAARSFDALAEWVAPLRREAVA
ncbi:MAG TPA: biliverdin-producing heme oxygenase [Jatrophihabitans sp.]|jgi:heme oxygenase|uniref:biliverdin-producing heme oxygenase n=1 Tax=Jatrophihabitans sp. TaxID=1932789 RepID=UPI002E046A0E|nr:biliverdin-producing heme oxygenase [Jatrophihabitans sp.]